MIEISHLNKVYGLQHAVDDISFNVEKGEIVGFLGPNGAGKTTTMKMITCFMPPTSGEILVDGMSVEEQSLDIRKRIGYLPESNPLYLDMNVIDFLSYIAELRNIDKPLRNKRVREILDICALGEVLHKDINQLSKGYRQRVGLAQAMIHDPDILILDEPTIGLDPNQVVDIRKLIKQLGREKTVILSTHILSEVQATCDRAVIIHRGKIVADATISELQQGAEKHNVIEIEIGDATDAIVEKFSTIEGVDEVREIFPDGSSVGRSFRISTKSAFDPRRDINKAVVDNNCVILGMVRQVRSLEEIFHKLTMQN